MKRPTLDPQHEEWRRLFFQELDGDPTAGEKIDETWMAHDSEYCEQCGDIFCPYGEPLHFHHDGCPACASVPEDKWEEFDTVLRVPMLRRRNTR